jgi:transcriptional regulator with XRE-family HTH domain
VVSARSHSLATRAYETEKFQLEWDNDISFHVAQNTIRLRKFRGKTQHEVGQEMGTSQSALARIESGDDNITLGKLKRLVTALRGRIRFAIEPQEVTVPRLPEWWTLVDAGLGASAWNLVVAGIRDTGATLQYAAGWNSHSQTQEATVAMKELVESAQAS